MTQSKEALAFFKRLDLLAAGKLPSLSVAMQPITRTQNLIRSHFRVASQENWLKEPWVGFVDVFHAPENARTIQHEPAIGNVFPLAEDQQRPLGAPCMVATADSFNQNWHRFSRRVLDKMKWKNTIVAGGAIQACMTVIPEGISGELYWKNLRDSDIDIFTWDLDRERLKQKADEIQDILTDQFPGQVVRSRSSMTITFTLPKPYRSVQLVLWSFESPAAVLAGFDLDISYFLYNGDRVFATPAAMVCMMRQCIVLDIGRYTPSIELRLAKYSMRGFAIEVEGLDRTRIDEHIFNVSFERLRGLALLLALERKMEGLSQDERLDLIRKLQSVHGYSYGDVFRGSVRKIEIGRVVDMKRMEVLTKDNPHLGALDLALWYSTAYKARVN